MTKKAQEEIHLPTKEPDDGGNPIILIVTIVTVIILLGAVVFVAHYFISRNKTEKMLEQERSLIKVKWEKK